MAKKVPDWLDDDDLFDDEDGGDEIEKGTPTLSRGGKGGDRGGKTRRDDQPKEKSARLGLRAQHRPGEQEVLKSPLVIGLGGAAIVLTIMSLAYYFIIGRDSVTKELMAIEEDLDNQRYAPAIKNMESFVVSHKGHEKWEEMRFKLSKARIDKEVSGSRTNWEAGIEQIDKFKNDNRDLEGYPDQKPMLAEYGNTIALGAIASAIKSPKIGDEMLKISETAEARLKEFSDPDNPPKDKFEKINEKREEAINVILRYKDLQAAYAEIDAHLANKRPLEALKTRRRLMDKHKDVEKLKELRNRLEATLELEQELVIEAEVDIKASKEARPLPVPAPLSLTLHTRTSTVEDRGDRIVFAVAQGVLYGVDTVTGDPVWRRTIGYDTPFFPISVETTIPGVLAFDTNYTELVLLNRMTGELAWRLPLSEKVDGDPVIHDGQIYLPANSNSLYKIDLQSGSASNRIKFSQSIHSPPVLTRDKEHLLIAGDEQVVYSMTVRPLKCVKVSYTAQNPGTINVPLMKLGKMLLMIENRNVGNAVLRVFRSDVPADGITLAGETTLDSFVLNRPVLRGNKLFVPGEKEQLNVYTVSDDKDQPPLAPVANPPGIADYSYNDRVYLLPGSDDRLWTASDSLRSFMLEQDALNEKNEAIKIGATGQPLQKVGTTLYVGQHLLYSDSIGLMEVDGEDIKSSTWNTVLGTGILAAMPTNIGGVLFLNKAGHVFNVSEKDITEGPRFRHKPESTLGLKSSLKDPIRAAVLPNSRIAVTRGGQQPRLWIVNQAGKIAEDFPLESNPVGDPIPMAGGALAVLPDKLRLVGVRGGGFVKEFLGEVQNAGDSQWSSVTALDENHAIVIDRTGKITKMQYRTSPSKHLQAAASVSLNSPVDLAPAIAGDKLFVTLPDGTLHMLNVTSFERESTAKLSRPAVVPIKVVGDLILVQTSDQKLHAYDAKKKLAEAWSIDMGRDEVSGTPIQQDGKVIFTTNQGAVKAVSADGTVAGSLQLDSPLEFGPFKVGSLLISASVDGSLYQIQSVLEGN